MHVLPVELKQLTVNEEGTFKAMFAVYGVPDLNGDILEPGSLSFVSDELPILVDHRGMQVGVGRAMNTADGAIIEGKFFLNTQVGRDAYEIVRTLGTNAKWSFGFQTRGATMREDGIRVVRDALVYEVSLTAVPAQPATGTIAVKRAVPFSRTGTTREGSWSRPNLSDFTDESWDDLPAAERRRIGRHFAWSANWPPRAFGDLKLPHHVPSKSGVGPAHWRGVVAAMAALLGARGGVDIPDRDRDEVYQHLARHYEEFNAEAPPMNRRGLELVTKELDALEAGATELARAALVIVRHSL